MSIFRDEREEKFILVYNSYVDEIYQYVYIRTGLDQALAEDITQEIFTAVYKGLSGFKGLCSERTWIFKIARNKLNDFYRKKYDTQFQLVEIDECITNELDDPTQDIQENIAKSIEKETVQASLNSLCQKYKIALTLKYIDEKSIKEIASIVGKSPKAIESVLQRAKLAFIKNYRKLSEKEIL